MPQIFDTPVGVEREYMRVSGGYPDAVEVIVYITKTNQGGRFAVRAEIAGTIPATINIVEKDTNEVVETVVLQPGFWPGPTAADKQAMGNRILQQYGISLAV